MFCSSSTVKELEISLVLVLLFVFFLVILFWGNLPLWDANGFQKNWLKQGVFFSEYID